MSSSADLLAEISGLLGKMAPEDRAAATDQVHSIIGNRVWLPNPGPQTEAYFSKADVLLYGGQAGGGKTDLLLGLALHEHQTSLLMRRLSNDVQGLIDRAKELLDASLIREGIRPRAKTEDGRTIYFAGAQNPGDEKAWMGRPRDFLGLDEATHFLESQVRFLMAWVRTTIQGQRTRTVFATNPPVDAAGQWVVPYFRPWLDLTHPNPAKHGELRWFCTVGEEDVEVSGPEPQEINGETLLPSSRTFIPAALSDNPYQVGTGYERQLDALPEPYKSALKHGNFTVGRKDDRWQVIPSAWVREAQARWTPDHPDVPMCAIGVDVSRGGPDQTILAARYDGWFAEMDITPGEKITSGDDVAALVIVRRRDNALPVIDMGGGWGTSPSDVLTRNGIEHGKYVGAAASTKRTADGAMGFVNLRAQTWWELREALDPDQEGGSPIILPPDPMLLADLTMPTFSVTNGPKVKIESKEDIRKRLGRSPDRGDAVVMAWWGGPRWKTDETKWREFTRRGGQPKVELGRQHQKRWRR